MGRAAIAALAAALAVTGQAAEVGPPPGRGVGVASEGAPVATSHDTNITFATQARVIARSEPHAGDVTATPSSSRPPTAGAVPNAPATGPQLSGSNSTELRLENGLPTGSGRSRNAGATANRLPSAPDAVLAAAANPRVRSGPWPNGLLQACVDHQLMRQGLNGFGDPPATRYPGGTPVPADSIRRYAYVLERSRLMRTECEASSPFR